VIFMSTSPFPTCVTGPGARAALPGRRDGAAELIGGVVLNSAVGAGWLSLGGQAGRNLLQPGCDAVQDGPAMAEARNVHIERNQAAKRCRRGRQIEVEDAAHGPCTGQLAEAVEHARAT
jgi:hypothetical protein